MSCFRIIILVVVCVMLASCRENNTNSVYDIEYKYPLKGGMCRVVTKEGKFGYQNAKGEMIINAVYDIAYDFNEGIAIVAVADSNGELGYMAISDNGSILHTVSIKDCILDTQYSNGFLLYKETATGRFAYLNKYGIPQISMPPNTLNASRFVNGKAYFATAGKSGYIDTLGNVISSSELKNMADAKSMENVGDIVNTENVESAMRAEYKTKYEKGNYILKSTVLEDSDLAVFDKNHPLYLEAKKVLKANLEPQDAASRRLILNYIEHLRTSYTTKDIDFLEQLFSEDALIIVGKVVKSAKHKELDINNKSKVRYNILSKRRYIANLKRVFSANKEIDVKFSDFKIMRHPTREGIYGVRLRQAYTSTLYSDDGWLFLLWDFRNEAMPQIHVRTWQENIPGGLPQDSLFGIRHFNLQ